MSKTLAPPGAPEVVDSRGPRFAAGVTTLVLVVVLLLHASAIGVLLLGLQAAVFALGAFQGPSATPYAFVFRRLLRRRLGPPGELEDVRPLKFAQAVGLGFSLIGVVGLLTVPLVGVVAVAFALAAAFLNAAFRYCLGCEIYLLLVRFRSRAVPAH